MNLVIKRGMTWKFLDLPAWSIALDGAVQGPQFDNENHKYSFDHHNKCLRTITLATCSQVLNAILLGLDPVNYTIYANDVDSDVCAAIWCLSNPERCKEPLAEKLINAIGRGDMYAGAISNGSNQIIEWIARPQTDSIRNGDYEKLSDDGLRPILESMLHRIDLYVDGEAAIEISKQQTHEEFKVLRQENGWALIESSDPHILSAVWHAGFEKVAVIRHLEDSIAVTIAKKSDFVDGFPLEKIYTAFNEVEEGWGGSSTIGGSVRNADGSRSKLSLKKITEIIDSVLMPKVEKLSTRPPKKKKKDV